MDRNSRQPAPLLSLLYAALSFIALSHTAVVPAAGQSTTPAPSPEARRADSLFRKQAWKEAALAYEVVVSAEPRNAQAWYRLGVASHSLGRFDHAIAALTRASEFNPNPFTIYNLACSYARNGGSDSALACLGRAASSGVFTAEQIGEDEDFTALRDLPRFRKVMAEADIARYPCKASPNYRQLDFWIGEWNVLMPGGQLAGTSSVQRILGECVIFENWTGTGKIEGKSFNVYNAAKGVWQQTWVSDQGSVLEFSGTFADDQMRYTAATRNSDGSTTLHKLTFFNLGPDRVRQLWEQSTDDGRKWSTVFDGMYVRR